MVPIAETADNLVADKDQSQCGAAVCPEIHQESADGSGKIVSVKTAALELPGRSAAGALSLGIDALHGIPS